MTAILFRRESALYVHVLCSVPHLSLLIVRFRDDGFFVLVETSTEISFVMDEQIAMLFPSASVIVAPVVYRAIEIAGAIDGGANITKLTAYNHL